MSLLSRIAEADISTMDRAHGPHTLCMQIWAELAGWEGTSLSRNHLHPGPHTEAGDPQFPKQNQGKGRLPLGFLTAAGSGMDEEVHTSLLPTSG